MVDSLNIYSGDPRIVVGPNGASVKFIGNQPVMDGGFENAVLISLGSKEWFANKLLPAAARLNSKFEAAHNQPITISGLHDIEQAARYDLGWMLKKGIFSKIEVTTTNPHSDRIKTIIDMWLYDSTFVRLEVTKAGQNWRYQMQLPANERVG